jgi:amidase
MSPIGLGNDSGGSVRNPAYANGIASIKPGVGRIPAGNETAAMNSSLSAQLMLEQGVLARRVADVRRGLEAVMGAHPRDPFAVDAPLAGPKVSRRVALVTNPDGGTTHPNVIEGVRRAGEALERAGYEVEEVSPPLLVESYIAWSELMMADTHILRPLLETVMGPEGLRFIDLTNSQFPAPTTESVFNSHLLRDRVAKAWQAFLFDYPLIVGPTWTQPPFHLGFDIQDAESANAVLELFRFVLPANLLGLPAACVPTGVIEGLPVGAQIISRRLREDLCLDAAEAIEGDLGVITPIDPR